MSEIELDLPQQLLKKASELVNNANELDELESLRVQFLGKKGEITDLLKQISSLPGEHRKSFGANVNEAKNALQQILSDKKDILQEASRKKQLEAEKIDVSLPGKSSYIGGSLHPITRTQQRIKEIFSRLGFDIATGPEIESDYFNFEALNIPKNHPARAMADTFYVDEETVLRTHTSPVQIRYMLDNPLPLQVIAPGRVYRCDSDVTHTPMFHQVEGMAIDKDITFADLKGVLTYFLQNFFESDVTLRFRPSYFPFTEPSAEVDMSCVFCHKSGCRICKHTGWLEVLGCGMMHPEVLKSGGVDSTKYSGYAFGMGVERLTMLRYGVNDLRLFFENDQRFLRQFGAY